MFTDYLLHFYKFTFNFVSIQKPEVYLSVYEIYKYYRFSYPLIHKYVTSILR